MTENDPNEHQASLEERLEMLEARFNEEIESRGKSEAESAMEIERIKKRYAKAESEAEDVVANPEGAEKILSKALKKIGKSKLIAAAVDELHTLIRLVKAYMSKEYREVPVVSIIAALGAIIYFVSPIDAIPDFIPGAGFTDDAAVIATVIIVIQSDLEDFRDWEKKQPGN